VTHPGATWLRMTFMAFDITTYAETAAPVRFDDLDYGAFKDRPLSGEALRCMRYMSDIESHTICYLRDLLVTPSHADPDVTTFLTMWALEEYWHGEALAKVLETHGIPMGPEHIRNVRKGLGWKDRIAPIHQAIIANVVGVDYVAVHMSWGAVNEWATHAAYTGLMEREQHPVLTQLLERIMRQESRHVAFYASQAKDRLARSAKARKLTRFALKRFWEPVGSGVTPKAETNFMVRHLFTEKICQQIDEKIDKLPGQSGLELIGKSWRAAAA
jgi:hypothetical protein